MSLGFFFPIRDYILRRFLLVIPTLFGITLITFLIILQRKILSAWIRNQGIVCSGGFT